MKQTLRIMIAETQNEITKNQVMIRLFQRDALRGSKNKNETMMGNLQGKVKALQGSMKDLEDFLQEELAKDPDLEDTK